MTGRPVPHPGGGPFLCSASRHNLAKHTRDTMSTFAPSWVYGKPGSDRTVLPVSNEWMTQGSCLGSDLDFHAEHQGLLRKAARVCTDEDAPCPVIDACLRYALAHMDDGDYSEPADGVGKHGVWGGTLPIDRWRMLGRNTARTERGRAV